MPEHKNRIAIFLPIILIVALGFIAYANSFSNQFLWDDIWLIKNNVFIKDQSFLSSIFSKSILGGVGRVSSYYRPLQVVSYSIDNSIWGMNIFGYHLTNIMLHIGVSLSLFWLLLTIFQSKRLATLASAFYVVHPIHTQAVTYISGRADPLCVLFMLLSFIFYIRQSKGSYFIMFAFYALALLSKELSVILPALILIYHVVFRRKVVWARFLSLLLATFTYMLIRFSCLTGVELFPGSDTVLDRIPGMFAAIFVYLRLLVFPYPLHAEYGQIVFHWSDSRVIAGVVVTLALILTAYMKRNNKVILFSIVWFFVALLPLANIYKIVAYMAEHFMYLPSIGFFLLVAYFVNKLFSVKKYKSLALVIAAFLILSWAGVTIRQNLYWRTPKIFYERTLKFASESAKMHYNRGVVYAGEGDYDRAGLCYNKALALDPEYAEAYYNLGVIYTAKGDHSRAASYYSKAIGLKPDYAEAHNNLGLIYAKKGDHEKAISAYRKAVELRPDYSVAYNNMGLSYISEGKFDQAMGCYNKAIEMAHSDADAYNNRGLLYGKYMNEFDKAIADFSRAIEINPEHVNAYISRAMAYRYKGEYDKAQEDYRKARSLRAENDIIGK